MSADENHLKEAPDKNCIKLSLKVRLLKEINCLKQVRVHTHTEIEREREREG